MKNSWNYKLHTAEPKSMRSFLLIILCFWIPFSVFAQTQSHTQATDTTKKQLKIDETNIDINQFNRGHIIDPLQLIQGKNPSLLITRGGNDPNGRFDMRIRGIKSFDITEPLILLDGIPVNSMDGIHPNDIESVEVLTNGADIAKYGMRGSNGVLSIKTRRGTIGETNLNYHSYLISERIINQPKVLSAESYLRNGGWNYGGETNWWNEITQRAVSHSHHLSLSSGSGKNRYYASVNFDDVDGIIRTSGFNRVNGRLTFEQKSLNNRLKLSGGLAGSARKSSHFLPNVLQQATSHNPTVPVYAEGTSVDEKKYGGYYERELFKIYNPVALLELNKLHNTYENLFIHLKSELALTSWFSAYVHYAHQSHNWENDIFFPRTSYYINAGRSTKGYASQSTVKRNNRYFSTGLNLQKSWNQFEAKGSFFYYFQDMDQVSLSAGARDLLTDVFSYNNLSALADFDRGLGSIGSSKHTHQMAGFSGNINLTFKDKYYLAASVSRDGSSRLGINNKWGLFYGLNAGAEITRSIRLRASYSKTGNIPSHGMISQALYGFQTPISTISPVSNASSRFSVGTFYNGEFIELTQKIQEANPNLQWEETREWSLGIDFSLLNGKLKGTLDYYNYASDQLIMFDREWLGIASFGYKNEYLNAGALKGSGLEYSFQYPIVDNANFYWNIGIVGARYFKTTLVDFNLDETDEFELRGRLGGICPFPVFRLKEGQPLGEIYGLTLNMDNPVSDGSWNMVDVDRDGVQDDIKDKSIIGNGMPKSYLGMNHYIGWRNWSINMQLRGIFGHDMVNHLQSFNSSPSLINTFNILESGLKELKGLTDMPDFTNRDVQKASYLRINHFTLGYDFKPSILKGFHQIQLYLSIQNLFTLTKYKGLDPELRMEDRNNSFSFFTPTPYADTGDPLVMGMERVDAYPATRGFLLGVKIGLK